VLPLQRFFQYRVLPHPWSEAVLALVARVALPFQRLRRASAKSVASVAADAHARRVTQACNATFATLAASAVLLLLSMGWVSSRYVTALRPAEATVAAPRPTPGDAKTGEPSPTNLPPTNLPPTNLPLATPAAVAATEADELNPLVARLESYRPILERSQWLRFSSELAREYLSDDAKKKELLGMVASNLQPVLLRVGGLLGALANLLLDSLMTLFFFSFFLKRIAADQAPDRGRSRPTSRYLVETIFSSGWLPSAGAEAIREAHVILDEVLSMLQTWVKGYLWIVIIESTVYITAFALLGIPYFHVLGLLAGMTVLLPFIGPIASLLLTLVVAFAFQGPSVTMFLLIAGVYFFANVILEQLVLFPTLVGEALGLNSLETIIVVLLGGLVAGLAGAVFSIPVAAILKYLVPHIYQTLSQRRAPTAALAGDSAAGVMADEQEIGERP
jgi:predicted PurR-regulated permease PerM